MMIEIEKKNLVSLLGKTQNIVEKRNTMPILVNVLLEAENSKLRIFATDLEVSLTDEADLIKSSKFRVAVNAKMLFDLVRELEDAPIQLVKKENNFLQIKQNKKESTMVGISADEYPVFPSYSTREFMKINSQILADMIEKTIYSVSNDETRYHLNGVFFEKFIQDGSESFRMVATDGHRLSLVSRKSENAAKTNLTLPQGVIIPRKGLFEIKKLLESVDGDFEMAIEGSQLVMRHESTVLMVRLIEGKYPNYQQLIPQNLNNHARVKRNDLLSSLKYVSVMSNQKYKGVTLSLSKGKMEVSSTNPETGEAKSAIEIAYTGGEMKIGFNARYILDVLNSIKDDEIDFELNDQLSPGLVRPHGDKNYTCVVMPMRI